MYYYIMILMSIIMELNHRVFSLADFPTRFQIWHLSPASVSMELINDLHHYVMFYLIIIWTVVVLIMFTALTVPVDNTSLSSRALGLVFKNRFYLTLAKQYLRISQSHYIEAFWTVVPVCILLAIGIPSVMLLYLLEEPTGYILVVFKVIGHQWYWSYEISDCSLEAFLRSSYKLPVGVSFDSYMIPTVDIKPGQLRLLEVDNALMVPIETPLVFIITSLDVIHSWSIPSLGVKVDAVPGRLNQVYLFITRCGEYYGQCSELCGINHGFMPIKLTAVDHSC